MTDFFRTRMGMKYYEKTMPEIENALQKIAKELKRMNDMTEKEDTFKGVGRWEKKKNNEMVIEELMKEKEMWCDCGNQSPFPQYHADICPFHTGAYRHE